MSYQGSDSCDLFFQAQTTLTTNDIVISKLTQILSYLRQGTRNKKLKKKDKGKHMFLEFKLAYLIFHDEQH